MTSNARELNKQILDRIASDPEFREQLLDDPRGAMERAGFVWEGDSGEDVSGYGLLFDGKLLGQQPNDPSTAMTCPPPPPGGTTAMTCPDPKPGIKPASQPPTSTVIPPKTS